MQRTILVLAVAATVVAACGGSMPAVPTAAPARASGQSALMDQTVAGQNKCNPKSADRPFIIEWDATDLSQFESVTSDDIVFVRYDGCDLRVIDSCRNDSVRGQLGAYKAVDWTSGSVEKMDISNEGELYAKLPLGVASLGGRVQAGEQFHMEYFVSGVRTATRPVVYRGDLDSVPGCAGATHFVYAYNLGAFALGSKKNIRADANATVWGFGGGGNVQKASAAEKRAGVLESCRGESAKEVQTCKAPIRLTLREIDHGSNPDAKAAVAPETPDALNLAGKVDAKMKRTEKAQGHAAAAQAKSAARDGKGCIAELDQADRLDPRPNVISTNASSYWSFLRAECLMMSGQCAAGRKNMRVYMEKVGSYGGPEQIDVTVDAMAGRYCQGGNLSPRDQLLQANEAMRIGGQTKKDPAYCTQAYERLKKAADAVSPNGPDDVLIANAKSDDHERAAASCLSRAGDCVGAWGMFQKSQVGASAGVGMFKSFYPHCKDYTPPSSGPMADPQEQRLKAQALVSAASQKMYNKDASCLSDLNQYDRLTTDAAQRTTSPGAAYAQVRVLCMMLAGKCAEGERLQRATLTAKNLSGNIIDANVKSLHQEWCK